MIKLHSAVVSITRGVQILLGGDHDSHMPIYMIESLNEAI